MKPFNAEVAMLRQAAVREPIGRVAAGGRPGSTGMFT
jgi:hypothetical protein